MIYYINSIQNTTFKNWKKLLTNKGRKSQKKYIVEGFHLVEEAIKYNQLEACILPDSLYKTYEYLLKDKDIDTYIVSDQIINELSTTITSQNIFGIVKFNNNELPKKLKGNYVLLDSLQDPGNVGTIIRTADAAGFSGVIIGDNCVDLYNDKTIRSMQGSQFHINIYKYNLQEIIPILKENNIKVLGTNLDKNSKLYNSFMPKPSVAIVLGNEGNGVSKDILSICDDTIYIPIIGSAESLNVSVAAGIIMYEFLSETI